ncbi:uncharacterized protein P174DRAFT_516444 [Aspergillus novofumigatus IBT 16806]|uniref:Uncharacterized protein n=1 Tax=Aspergillus novofumigatus (strain IBT 16806) TaxID=1392255 RepID=A0A2I1BSZ1_ASPN1|nr:uncharacterized protein P174DRAFT_516444 [Aspergillus novofumigatus IBT 16806]PKX88513.1 hypothetical protein P174DRAFT_516444 [Aspergillus novofumigatus IBT 16806]
MPSKGSHSNSLPEARGLKYDESDMALFHAKLSYHSTIEERMASKDANLASISEHQARILKRWEMLKQVEKEMADKGKCLSPAEKKQLAQYEWRYKRLEELATKTTGVALSSHIGARGSLNSSYWKLLNAFCETRPSHLWHFSRTCSKSLGIFERCRHAPGSSKCQQNGDSWRLPMLATRPVMQSMK